MEIVSLTSKNFQSVVEIAIRTLKKGCVIVAPTDTVYGLLANAKNANAVQKVYRIKKRELNKPLPIFVKDIAGAKRLALIGIAEEKMLAEAWPGKTTFVLKTNPKATVFGAESGTIALRIPNHPFLNKLFEQIDFPLTGTSANLAGKPASTKISGIFKQFEGIQPDLVIDAGDLPDSKPSRIVDLTDSGKKILRHG